MKRPTGVTLIAILMVGVAAILALGCFASFFIAVMGITSDSSDAVSAAITGMALGGGFSLLILAGVAAGLALAVFNLQEWAWSASMATIGVGTALTVISLVALRRYVLIPVGPSLVCHIFLVATAIWMLAYLSRPRVKQAFNVSSV
ncbi:MAG: hypothetical protein ABSF68_10055 [Candidatus Acidiferrales bacterium]